MAVLSGTAKLSNGDPAKRIVAVHPLRGHVRTAVPALDGSYSIPGVPKGEWLVSAEGPAGYRPQTHVLEVERVPEAEALYEKAWEAWSFNGGRVGDLRGSTMVGTNPGALVPGRLADSQALRITAIGTHSYNPGAPGPDYIGYSTWFKLLDPSAAQVNLPTITSGNGATDSNYAYVYGGVYYYNGVRIFSMSGRLATTGAPVGVYVELPVFDASLWHHVVAVIDPAGFTLWIDGSKYRTTASGLPRNGAVRHMNFFSPGMDLDDVIQLVAVPTDDEVAYLYGEGRGPAWSDIRSDAGFLP